MWDGMGVPRLSRWLPIRSSLGQVAGLAAFELGPSYYSGPPVVVSYVNFSSDQLHVSKGRLVRSHFSKSIMKQITVV
jgi:hypothetical protein